MSRAEGLDIATPAASVDPQEGAASADGTTVDLDHRAQAALCLLAARLLLREMDEPARAALLEEGAHQVLDKLAPGCAAYLEAPWSEQTIETAAAEYCRLFLLPGGAPPFVSAWLADGTDQGHAVVAQCEAAAEALGLEGPTPDNLPPDHLGVLMIVLAEAWQVADAEGQPARVMRAELLGTWLDSFLAKLEALTVNPLYRALGGVIRGIARS